MPSYPFERHTWKHSCKTCRRNIPVDDLEVLFHGQLRKFVSSPQKLTAYLEPANDQTDHKAQLIDALKTEQREVERAMEMLSLQATWRRMRSAAPITR